MAESKEELKSLLRKVKEKSEKAGLKLNIHMGVPMADKGPYSQSYDFSNSHVQKWELDHKEGWVPKNWCFQTVVLEMFERPLDCKEIKPVNPKGNQNECSFTDAEAPILWPPNVKSKLTGKDPDAGKDWGQEKKGVTEDKMVEWHHQLNRAEPEQSLGHSEERGSLACCIPWGHRVGKDWVTEQQQYHLVVFITWFQLCR